MLCLVMTDMCPLEAKISVLSSFESLEQMLQHVIEEESCSCCLRC